MTNRELHIAQREFRLTRPPTATEFVEMKALLRVFAARRCRHTPACADVHAPTEKHQLCARCHAWVLLRQLDLNP